MIIVTRTAWATKLVPSVELDGEFLPRLECMMTGLGREIVDWERLRDLAAKRQGEQSKSQELHDKSEI